MTNPLPSELTTNSLLVSCLGTTSIKRDVTIILNFENTLQLTTKLVFQSPEENND